MSATSDNNKRIAKNFPSKRVQSQACLNYAERKESQRRIVFNTLMLYFRMILLMLISLYTSRIVLATLGETGKCRGKCLDTHDPHRR